MIGVLVFVAFLIGFFAVLIPFYKQFKEVIELEPPREITKDDLEKTQVTIDKISRNKLSYICGDCGTGMDVTDYVCPQCMGKEKLKLE